MRRRLSAGLQGEVYEVLDTYEGDVVALKLLTNIPLAGPWAEAQILRRLADRHILPIRNADVAAGQPYLVTELAMHGTLQDRLDAVARRGVDVDDVVRWMRHACHGVARAHDLRLLHNDLKPANLFLNADGECLVGDFGCAALIPPGNTAAWPPGASAETAAPEVARGWGTPATSASTASDVYSLGACAFWLIAGRTAHDFTGAPDFAAKMAVVASQACARLRDVAPHVPRSVAAVVAKSMSPAPADRYATVTEMAAALGGRPSASRKWRRTDEHAGHLACWRGETDGGGSTYVLCLEAGPRPTQLVITSRHGAGGSRIVRGCRTTPARSWAVAVRSVMRELG